MPTNYNETYFPVLLQALIAMTIAGALLLISFLLGKKVRNRVKDMPGGQVSKTSKPRSKPCPEARGRTLDRNRGVIDVCQTNGEAGSVKSWRDRLISLSPQRIQFRRYNDGVPHPEGR